MYRPMDTRPWYRQFWPWFLIAIPAAGVVASLSTVIIASHSPDGVVVDDYYKRGLAINTDLARDRRAADLALRAQLRMQNSQRVQVVLTGAETDLLPALDLRLLHPTKAGRDQRVTLQRTAGGRFEAAVAHLEPAHWHVLIEPPGRDWRLQDRLQWPQTAEIRLRPAQ